MKNVLFLAFVAVVCSTGTRALKCNFCVGSQSSDCARGISSSLGKQYCVQPNEMSTESSHLKYQTHNMLKRETITVPVLGATDVYCLTLSLKDNVGSSNVFDRSCGYIPKGQDICQVIKENIDYVDKCSACSSDFCN